MTNDTSKICSFEVCRTPQDSSGLCIKHYMRKYRHGDPAIRLTAEHGMTHAPEYTAWCHMKARCTNAGTPKYADYGGRGITVCGEWIDSFEAFYSDMGPRPNARYTLERRDVEQGYSPDNCYWATRQTQAINRRLQNNNTSGYRGVSYDKKRDKWAANIGIKNRMIHLGRFETAEEAAIAYDRGAKEIHGSIAHLNFP